MHHASCISSRRALIFAMALATFAASAIVHAAASTDDILPGNLLKNGDFENITGRLPAHYERHLQAGVQAQIVTGGFESDHLLSITVPTEAESLRTSENFLAQTIRVDPTKPCRSYRVTWWLRYKVLSDAKGGVGVMVSFFDGKGDIIGRTGSDHLLRLKETKNQWQAIDQIKDGFWDNYELAFTLPPTATAFRVECGLFKAAGNADFDRIILKARPTVPEMLAEKSPVAATITTNVIKPRLSEQLFSVNAEFRYPGIYKGTLPESDPASRRREFAAALRQAGVRVLRFPGGMPTHEYFTEGPEAQAKLFHAFRSKSGYYRDMWYPLFDDVLDFCRAYGFEMNFEINTQFFQDTDGAIYPITDNRNKQERPDLYGKNRLPAATAAFERFVSSLPPAAIRYWEFGNEEFALMTVKDYADIVRAFTPVIKRYNPDAIITVTGNTWPVRLCRELHADGTLEHIDYLSAHYPWGDHWRPGKGGEKDLERFVCGTLNWAINTNAHLKQLRAAGFDKVKMSGNETSVFKFHTWNAHRVIYTPAHGLLLAANWMEAMKIPDMDNLTFHDLESPFFGMIFFDQFYNSERGIFQLLKRDEIARPEDVSDGQFYLDRYQVLPSGHAMKQLSHHVNLNVLEVDVSVPVESKRALFDLLASSDGERLLVTLVNRGAATREMTLDVLSWGREGQVRIGGIRWPGLDELPRPPIEINGDTNIENGRVKQSLEPFSITRLEIRH